MSKAFVRIWHKSLLSKLPSYEFYPSLYPFISSFLYGSSISAVLDGHCSTPKSINSGVPQSSELSPTLFLLFINDFFSSNKSLIHSYAYDSTLHYSNYFKIRPTPQEVNYFRLEAARRLTSDLVIFFEWGKRNLVSINSKPLNVAIDYPR